MQYSTELCIRHIGLLSKEKAYVKNRNFVMLNKKHSHKNWVPIAGILECISPEYAIAETSGPTLPK
ncbi:hypothetical protein IQ31_00440 [Sphingobacterium siyangense]|uniref:Uncharacterized protein n=1 Tax=Sphingobacterium siyangense TaxID=459529 RepID=A0A562N1C9_9SPHI|nr:hypothetical protein IQ31_00440 [Sphingobacterium siyangense]